MRVLDLKKGIGRAGKKKKKKKKNGGKVRHCLHQALKITRRRYKRAGGEKPIVGSLVCACPWHGPIQSRATI